MVWFIQLRSEALESLDIIIDHNRMYLQFKILIHLGLMCWWIALLMTKMVICLLIWVLWACTDTIIIRPFNKKPSYYTINFKIYLLCWKSKCSFIVSIILFYTDAIMHLLFPILIHYIYIITVMFFEKIILSLYLLTIKTFNQNIKIKWLTTFKDKLFERIQFPVK
jgi:hypothetical protein